MRTFTYGVAFILACAGTADGRILKTVEAEGCVITCASQEPRDAPSQFASGNGMTPVMWGMAKGDSIEWEEEFLSVAEGLKLGIRYAFDHANLEQRKGPWLPESLVLDVNGHRMDVPLSDTGHWEQFQTVLVKLPRLGTGKHVFRLEAAAERSDRNIDCFFFMRGELDDIPIGVRQTVIATHRDGFFELWTAPETVLPHEQAFVLESCAKIFDYLQDQTAFAPPDEKVRIHIRPDKYVGPHQFQNVRGIWFSDSLASTGIGGWCHEMNHLFQPHVPGWMGHPLVRVNDAMVLPQALFPEHIEEFRSDPNNKERHRRGRDFLKGIPPTTNDPHTVAFALHVRYGPELQRKFYHLLAADVAAGILDKGEKLDPEQFVHYMSQAAGQDVRPLFERLDGFPEEVESRY